MKTSESIKAVAAALTGFQAEVGAIEKKSKNPYFKSKYADLPTVMDAVREPLHRHGLSVVQSCEPISDGRVNVVTRIMHTSGEWIESDCAMAVQKPDPQGYGSTITYGRRYGIQAALVLSAEDDDGEGGMTRSVRDSKPKAGCITEAQRKLMFATATESKVSTKRLREMLVEFGGWESTSDIPAGHFEDVLEAIKDEGKKNADK